MCSPESLCLGLGLGLGHPAGDQRVIWKVNQQHFNWKKVDFFLILLFLLFIFLRLDLIVAVAKMKQSTFNVNDKK